MPIRNGRLFPRVVLFVTLTILAAACTSGPSDEGVDADPRAAIEGFDASTHAGFAPRARLNIALLSDPGAARVAALDLVGSEDPDVRIAALYVLSLTLQREDADTLAPLLASGNPAERVLAASAMLAMGDGRAVPVLIETLDTEDRLPFGAPPLRVWQQARFALLSFTGEDLGLREATTVQEAATTAPEWQAWWADAERSFQIVRTPDRFGS